MNLQVQTRWPRRNFTLQIDTTLTLTGVTALFGRSGCGKTSLLRVLAGLERVAGSQVRFGDAVWQDGRHFVPLHRRRVGLVFQEHSLLPHLSAGQNLLYGFKRTPIPDRQLQPTDIISLLGLEALLDHRVHQLSGGQRQRVALGRALLASPRWLLLDEPLAALDQQTKREIMPYLTRLSREVGIPMMLVTHVPDEVERLADRVLFMEAGRIVGAEGLQSALSKPDSPLFVGEGPVSVLDGTLMPPDADGLCRFVAGAVEFRVAAAENQPQGIRRLRIQARDVTLALSDPERISVVNHLPVTIVDIHRSRAGECVVSCRMANDQLLLAQISAWSVGQLQLTPGAQVFALIKSAALHEG